MTMKKEIYSQSVIKNNYTESSMNIYFSNQGRTLHLKNQMDVLIWYEVLLL